jgi:hypothetical protein
LRVLKGHAAQISVAGFRAAPRPCFRSPNWLRRRRGGLREGGST